MTRKTTFGSQIQYVRSIYRFTKSDFTNRALFIDQMHEKAKIEVLESFIQDRTVQTKVLLFFSLPKIRSAVLNDRFFSGWVVLIFPAESYDDIPHICNLKLEGVNVAFEFNSSRIFVDPQFLADF